MKKRVDEIALLYKRFENEKTVEDKRYFIREIADASNHRMR
jgi:GTP cyclohydrolase FolE2